MDKLIVGIRKLEVWRDADAATATGARGQYLGDEGKIMLDPRLPGDVARLTLIHEACHAGFEQSSLTAGKQVEDEKPDVDELLEEKLCTWLETFIPQLVRDNPALFGMS